MTKVERMFTLNTVCICTLTAVGCILYAIPDFIADSNVPVWLYFVANTFWQLIHGQSFSD